MRILTFTSRSSLRIFGYLFFACTLLLSIPVHAYEYVPLVGLPGFMDKGSQSLPDYVNAVYLLTIGLGALVGVLRISLAGIKYALTDIVTQKGDAKHEIYGVLLGLAVLLIPFIVLNTINPNLTNLDVLSGIQKIKTMKVDTSTVTNSSIGTQDMTPRERAELKASCAGFYYKTASGQECCGAEGYTGEFSCNAEIKTTRADCGTNNWDEGVGVCLTKDSAYTYSTKQGGGWSSQTEKQWITRCGGTEEADNLEIAVDNTNNTISYSCKK